MFEAIKQMSERSVEDIKTLHAMLDATVHITAASFPQYDDDIRVMTDGTVLSIINEKYAIKISRMFNPYMVKVEIINNNTILAECIMSTDGSFKESYVRFPDIQIREQVGKYFCELSTVENTYRIVDTTADNAVDEVEPEIVDDVSEPDVVG